MAISRGVILTVSPEIGHVFAFCLNKVQGVHCKFGGLKPEEEECIKSIHGMFYWMIVCVTKLLQIVHIYKQHVG